MLKLPGWVGLDKTERRQKAVPLKDTIQEHWKSIKEARSDMDALYINFFWLVDNGGMIYTFGLYSCTTVLLTMAVSVVLVLVV